MKVCGVFVLYGAVWIKVALCLTQEQEFEFVADYCVARHFKSVTLITWLASEEDFRFMTLLHKLNEKGIRLAVQKDERAVLKFSASTLHIVMHDAGLISNLLLSGNQLSTITSGGKHWLILIRNEENDLKSVMTNFTFAINSDVIAAVSYKSSIELQEIYTTGAEGKNLFNTLGSWKLESLGPKLDMFGFEKFKLERRRNLLGQKIRISSVNLNPQYTIVGLDENNKTALLGGYVGNIVNSLRSQLNFTYEVKLLEGYAYGLFYHGNNTWTGLMGDLQTGEADMTGCEISNAANRLDSAEFSLPIQIIGRRLHFKRPDRQFKWDTFLKPFSSSIWITLSLTLPLVAFVTFWLGKLSPYKKKEDADHLSTLGSDLIGAIAALALQGWPGNYGSSPRRLFIWIIFVSYMIVSLSYSAKMVAMRTVEKPELPITGLASVLERSDWDIGFISKALERGVFESSAPDTLMGKIWNKKIVPKIDRTLVSDNIEGLQKAFNGKYVYLGFHSACEKILQNDFGPEKACQMQVLPEDLFKGGIAIGYKRNSTLREFIDHRLMRMKEAGILDIELKHALPKPYVCEAEAFSKINILDVAPALILLAFGMGVSAFVLALECIWNWRNQNLNRGNQINALPDISIVYDLQEQLPRLKVSFQFSQMNSNEKLPYLK